MRTFELTIEVLSPLHIGDARGRLTPLDFFQDHRNVYLVDERAWAEALAREGGIDRFVRYVEEQDGHPSLDAYLEGLKPSAASALRRAVLRSVPKAEPLRVSNLHPFITDPASRGAYLPASSLKGVLRGAILYRLAGGSRELAALKERALAGKVENPGTGLDDLLRASLPRGKNRQGPHSNWLRGLKLSDAYPEQAECTEVREVRIVSLNPERGYHYGARGARLFVEVVRPGTRFRGRLTYDDELWDLLRRECGQEPPFAFEDWLSYGREKYSHILRAEKEFFERAGLSDVAGELESIFARGANLRLGWGSGLLAASAVLHFSPEERRTLRQIYFPRREHTVFPQSRKVVMEKQEPRYTFGWVKIDVRSLGEG